ncbi:MAG: hypothetical protein ACOYOZ_14665, partial [Pirellula sp.]
MKRKSLQSILGRLTFGSGNSASSICLLACLLAHQILLAQTPATAPLGELDPLDAELTEAWTSSVLPAMKKHCGECHMDGANEAGVNLGDYS